MRFWFVRIPIGRKIENFLKNFSTEEKIDRDLGRRRDADVVGEVFFHELDMWITVELSEFLVLWDFHREKNPKNLGPHFPPKAETSCFKQ